MRRRTGSLVERALEALPALEAIKEQQRKKLSKARQERVKEARVSTTDPEARVMKMGDGGFRPAFDIELATDGAGPGAILGVEVSQQGSDGGAGRADGGAGGRADRPVSPLST